MAAPEELSSAESKDVLVGATSPVMYCSVFIAAFLLVLSGSLLRAWPSVRRTPAFWLLAYYLLCALSFAWSVAPVFSLYRACEYIVFFFATFVIIAQYRDFISVERAFLLVATTFNPSADVRQCAFSWDISLDSCLAHQLVLRILCDPVLLLCWGISRHDKGPKV